MGRGCRRKGVRGPTETKSHDLEKVTVKPNALCATLKRFSAFDPPIHSLRHKWQPGYPCKGHRQRMEGSKGMNKSPGDVDFWSAKDGFFLSDRVTKRGSICRGQGITKYLCFQDSQILVWLKMSLP